MKRLLLMAIDLYQATRFLRKPTCRFYPSCSSYLRQAIVLHGCLLGILLGIRRLLKCHPLHMGGVDEVPLNYHFTLR